MLQETQLFLFLGNYANDASVQPVNSKALMLLNGLSLPLNLTPDDHNTVLKATKTH